MTTMFSALRFLAFASVTVLGVALTGCAADSSDPADDGVDDESTDPSAQTEDALTEGCSNCTIVPQKSIRGVKMSMTASQVRGVLGKPGKVENLTSEIAGPYKLYTYGLTTISIFVPGKVLEVRTRSPKMKTANGVGVGSSEADVKSKVN